MNKLFGGWKQVFSFTLSQLVKGKAFLSSTIIIALVCFLAPVLICAFDAKPQEEVNIDSVLLVDKSGFEGADYSFLGMLDDRFKDTLVESVEADENNILQQVSDKGNRCAGVIISKTEESYNINIYIPQNSELSKDDGEELAEVMKTAFENNKYVQAGFTEEQLKETTAYLSVDIKKIGEGEESFALMMVRVFAPMFVGLVIYFMVILYGQAIAKSMLTEKTSKILELLLTSTTSLSLITGKIFAMIVGALFQLATWVLSVILGLFAGVAYGRTMQEDYNIGIGKLLDMLKENNVGSAFSPAAIIIAVLAVVLGFILFSVLAGSVGSFINRAEDMGSVMMWFQYSVVIGFIIPYFGGLQENSTLIMIGRYFPLCIPFSLPAEVLIGNVSISGALVAIAILIVTTVIVILATGKIYRAMVLYNGDKPKLKDVLKIIGINS